MENIKGGFYLISNVLDVRMAVPTVTFMADSTPTAIRKKLYEYRSKIAHGDVPDFAGRLQMLRDQQTAIRFLEDAVRQIVRHALTEPDLVDGLKPV